mmetsp:Transcript_26402/g.78685  ORF Transcript_26402/g.78685 Transcript_26402/m.78685 type:complete len:235 (+) Transcript_26402:134-838(+)
MESRSLALAESGSLAFRRLRTVASIWPWMCSSTSQTRPSALPTHAPKKSTMLGCLAFLRTRTSLSMARMLSSSNVFRSCSSIDLLPSGILMATLVQCRLPVLTRPKPPLPSTLLSAMFRSSSSMSHCSLLARSTSHPSVSGPAPSASLNSAPVVVVSGTDDSWIDDPLSSSSGPVLCISALNSASKRSLRSMASMANSALSLLSRDRRPTELPRTRLRTRTLCFRAKVGRREAS